VVEEKVEILDFKVTDGLFEVADGDTEEFV
jgi:hypothetical protein